MHFHRLMGKHKVVASSELVFLVFDVEFSVRLSCFGVSGDDARAGRAFAGAEVSDEDFGTGIIVFRMFEVDFSVDSGQVFVEELDLVGRLATEGQFSLVEVENYARVR